MNKVRAQAALNRQRQQTAGKPKSWSGGPAGKYERGKDYFPGEARSFREDIEPVMDFYNQNRYNVRTWGQFVPGAGPVVMGHNILQGANDLGNKLIKYLGG
jgi:hypothetical protein